MRTRLILAIAAPPLLALGLPARAGAVTGETADGLGIDHWGLGTVPEPAPILLLGLAALGFAARRRAARPQTGGPLARIPPFAPWRRSCFIPTFAG